MNCNHANLPAHSKNESYFYCQNCGEIADKNGKTVVPRSARCPGWAGHHAHDACSACGNDERNFPKCRTMNSTELAEYRVSEGLPPESAFMVWLIKRRSILERVNRGEIIQEKDYLDNFSASV